MRSALKWCVVPLLASSLLAQTATDTKPKKTARKAARAATAQDVQALKDALAAQQQQIEQLRQEMRSRETALEQAQQQAQQAQQQLQQAQAAAADAQQKATSAQATADAQKDSVDKLNSQLTDVQTTLTNTAINTQDEQKRTTATDLLLSRLRFTGDVRVRGESYFQQNVADRNRARVRVRFGIDGRLTEDFVGGFALATGSQADPTTTNETFNNFFTRKTISLDRGYITYNPVAHKWLSLTGGKFAYLWQRTSVTGDPDLNPEGFDEKFSKDFNNPHLKNVTLQGIEEIFSEASGGTDSYNLGGQLSAKLQMGPWTATPSFLIQRWQQTSVLLNVPLFNNPKGTSNLIPNSTFNQEGTNACVNGVQGAPPPSLTVISGQSLYTSCAFAPNGMTNAVFTDAKGKAAFWSGFLYADFILNNQIKTGLSRLPVNLLLEFEDNLAAADHPLSSTPVTPLKVNPASPYQVLTNLGSQNKEYGADISIGQTKNVNDLQFGYAWLRQEQDSVLASFAESDQRAPTNILQNRFYANWKLKPNTLASFTWWHGRTLNTNLENNAAQTITKDIPLTTPGLEEKSLNRLQFDLVYSF